MTFNTEGTILYVAVCNRHCIYQIPYDANTHTFGNPVLFVGAWDESGYVNGTGATVRLNKPEQLAFDADGNMFVPERENHIIRAKSHQLDLLLYMLDSLDKVALVMDSPKKLSSISRNV